MKHQEQCRKPYEGLSLLGDKKPCTCIPENITLLNPPREDYEEMLPEYLKKLRRAVDMLGEAVDEMRAAITSFREEK